VSTRIVFELVGDSKEDALVRAREVLDEAGAEFVSAPTGLPAGIVTAVLPDGTDVDAALARLHGVEGVGRAEVDAPRETFGST